MILGSVPAFFFSKTGFQQKIHTFILPQYQVEVQRSLNIQYISICGKITSKLNLLFINISLTLRFFAL